MKTVYADLYGITELQSRIMRFVEYWVTTENTPTPQKEIVEELERRGFKKQAVVSSLKSLLQLSYIRKAIISEGALNRTFYVQLRRV